MTKFFIIAGLILVGVAAYLLFLDYNKPQTVPVPPQKESIATIETLENSINVENPEDHQWKPALPQTSLHSGERVRVSEESFVAVQLSSSRIWSNDPSIFGLTKSPNGLEVRLESGDIFVENCASPVQLQSRGATIKAEGADVRVMTNSEGKSQIQAISGKVSLTDKNSKHLDLAIHEAADLNDGVVFQTHKMAVVLQSPAPKSKMVWDPTNHQRNFQWQNNDNSIHDELLQISRSPVFSTKTTVNMKGHLRVTASLFEGFNYWRLSWSGKDHPHSEFRTIEMSHDNQIELARPASGTTLSVTPQANRTEIEWSTSLAAKFFTVEVSRDKDLKKLLLSHTVVASNGQRDVLKDFPSDTYYWRVRAFGQNNQLVASSVISSFTINVKMLSEPELITPAAEITWDDTSPLEFNWKKMEEAQKYRFGIYADKSLKSEVFSKITNGTRVSWQWIEPKEYFWAVKALDEKNIIIGQSEARRFQVAIAAKEKTSSFELLSPKDQTEMTRTSPAETGQAVLFQWKILRSPPGPLEIFISHDAEFKDVELRETVHGNSFTALLKRDGLYFWKLGSQSQDGKQEELSTVATFSLKGQSQLTAAEAISPSSKARIESETAIPVTFNWRPGENAIQYHFILKQADSHSTDTKVVADKMVKEVTLTTEPLEPGIYFWNVTSLGAQGRTKGWTRDQSFVIGPHLQLDAPVVNEPVVK